MKTMIEDWCAEYGLDASLISFAGYTLAGESVGCCKGYAGGRSEIHLHRKLEGHSCAS